MVIPTKKGIHLTVSKSTSKISTTRTFVCCVMSPSPLFQVITPPVQAKNRNPTKDSKTFPEKKELQRIVVIGKKKKIFKAEKTPWILPPSETPVHCILLTTTQNPEPLLSQSLYSWSNPIQIFT